MTGKLANDTRPARTRVAACAFPGPHNFMHRHADNRLPERRQPRFRIYAPEGSANEPGGQLGK